MNKASKHRSDYSTLLFLGEILGDGGEQEQILISCKRKVGRGAEKSVLIVLSTSLRSALCGCLSFTTLWVSGFKPNNKDLFDVMRICYLKSPSCVGHSVVYSESVESMQYERIFDVKVLEGKDSLIPPTYKVFMNDKGVNQ